MPFSFVTPGTGSAASQRNPTFAFGLAGGSPRRTGVTATDHTATHWVDFTELVYQLEELIQGERVIAGIVFDLGRPAADAPTLVTHRSTRFHSVRPPVKVTRRWNDRNR
jgi:hypothetical protein